MADEFQSNRSGLSSPASRGATITPNNNNDLPTYTRAIYVGGGGNLSLIPVGQEGSISLADVPAGTFVPIRAKRVLQTGTSATSLVALW